jgi:CubicO group peptidase (beta-lactamase class C family)
VSWVADSLSGRTICSKAYGHRDFEEKEAMSVDTAGWAASMSKLMTSIATLRAVELGLVGLDDDVADVLPELRQKEVMVAYDRETKTPRFEPLTEKITLR